MFEKYIFQVPTEFRYGIATKSLERFGSIIKDTHTGKIVAHLQETSLGQQLVGSLTGSPFSALDAASSLVANAQLARLKKMVEGLQMLQYANLGVGLAGIGVSVVGFAVVSKRLSSINQSLEKLSRKIDQKFAELYLNQLYRDLHSLHGVLEGIEATKRLSAPKAELLAAASRLSELRSGIRGHIEYQLQQNTFDEQLFTQLTTALLLSDNARVEAYLLADEYDSAHYNSVSIADSYSELFDELTPYDLSQKRVIRHQDLRERVSGEHANKTAGINNLVTGLRDVTDAALTKPILIEQLDAHGISGPEYIRSLKDETEEPVVLLRFES